MSFKGLRNNDGRKPGTPNKITNEVRVMFGTLLEANLDQLQNDINALKPYERIRVILELAKFVIPTLKATEMTANLNDRINPVILQITNEND